MNIDRLRFDARNARSWKSCHTVSLGGAYEHKPMGTTIDHRTDRRRPWSIHKLTLHLFLWKLSATLTVWTDR